MTTREVVILVLIVLAVAAFLLWTAGNVTAVTFR